MVNFVSAGRHGFVVGCEFHVCELDTCGRDGYRGGLDCVKHHGLNPVGCYRGEVDCNVRWNRAVS